MSSFHFNMFRLYLTHLMYKYFLRFGSIFVPEPRNAFSGLTSCFNAVFVKQRLQIYFSLNFLSANLYGIIS